MNASQWTRSLGIIFGISISYPMFNTAEPITRIDASWHFLISYLIGSGLWFLCKRMGFWS